MLNKMVTLLEKTSGVWTETQEILLLEAGIDVERQPRKPHRLVALNKPFPGSTFQSILGRFDFTTMEVPYDNRWDD